MDLSELAAAVEDGTIDTVIVAAPDMQGRLVGKRQSARHFLDSGAGGVGTCSVVLAWGQDHALDPGYALSGWDNGYPDMVLRPDMATLARYAWFERTAIVMGDALTPGGAPIDVAPRGALARLVRHLSERGLHARLASELEFFLYDETPASAQDKGFVNLRTRHATLHPETVMRTSQDEAYLGPLRSALHRSGVAVEMVKAEYSPGQIEINLAHADAMKAADDHMMLKAAAKEIALQQGMIASFMAKPDHALGGSSCHVHLSLRDADGQPVFADGADGAGMSHLMRHFLGGLTHHLRDIFLFFAPTTNSYRRLRPATFAPDTVTWGEDNRTVAFRLVGRGAARRIENRIPGADVNPYLVYAAMLAAGLRGIDRKLEPTGAAVSGNAYDDTGAPALPQSLDEATDAFATSELIGDCFGEAFRDHYANFGRQAILSARAAVTDYERRLLLMDI